MRIQPGELIAGQSALALRKLMRQGRVYGPTTSGNPLSTITEVLGIDLSRAKQVYQDLYREGYIEPIPEHHPFYQPDHWFTTTKGNALAGASAKKPIKQRTAERLIEEFLARVKEINSGEYVYRVGRVILFGSCLGDEREASTVGDVDLSIELVDRYSNPAERHAAHNARIETAMLAGRVFSDHFQMLCWPDLEVWRKLKNRSPSLSLHNEEREHILRQGIPSRIIYEMADEVDPSPEDTTGKPV